MTDGSGTVVWAADYKPFGEVNITTNTITNNLGFPGQYRDAETGLIYNMNRNYNKDLGRYGEADPTGLAAGINLFVYAEDNPLSKTDRYGLSVWPSGYTQFPPNGTLPPAPGTLYNNGKSAVPSGFFIYYGKWCGPYWTGGQIGLYDDNKIGSYSDPIDKFDSACRDHDYCYKECRKQWPCWQLQRKECMRNCDRILARDAEAAGHQYSSPLWWQMKFSIFDPDPGADDCKCKK